MGTKQTTEDKHITIKVLRTLHAEVVTELKRKGRYANPTDFFTEAGRQLLKEERKRR